MIKLINSSEDEVDESIMTQIRGEISNKLPVFEEYSYNSFYNEPISEEEFFNVKYIEEDEL